MADKKKTAYDTVWAVFTLLVFAFAGGVSVWYAQAGNPYWWQWGIAALVVGFFVMGMVKMSYDTSAALEKKAREPAAGEQPDDTDSSRTCPYCAEQIKAAAIVCRYCGKDVTPLSASAG